MSIPLPSDDFLINLVNEYKLFIVPNPVDNTDYLVFLSGTFSGEGIPIDRNNIGNIKVKHNIIRNFDNDSRHIVVAYFNLLFDHFHSLEIDFEYIPPTFDRNNILYYNLLKKNDFCISSFFTSTLWYFIFVLLTFIEYHINFNSVIEINEKDNISNDNIFISSSSSTFINLPKKKKHIRKI